MSSRAFPGRMNEGMKTHLELSRNIPQAEGLKRTKGTKEKAH